MEYCRRFIKIVSIYPGRSSVLINDRSTGSSRPPWRHGHQWSPSQHRRSPTPRRRSVEGHHTKSKFASKRLFTVDGIIVGPNIDSDI